MAHQVGLRRALEIVLSARNFDADEAERVGTINRAFDADVIGPYVDALAERIALWPSASNNATNQCVIESIKLPVREALRAEAYWLYPATSPDSRSQARSRRLTMMVPSLTWTTSVSGLSCWSRFRASTN